MNVTRRNFITLASGAAALGLAACGGPQPKKEEEPADQGPKVDLKEFEALALDSSAWKYDKSNDCYYQLGLSYCLKPAAPAYESLAIFVPGAYFDAKENGSTYACTVKEDATVGGFTPKTAPVVMPVNSSRLSPQTSPTAYSYEGLGRYLKAGMVYVYAGFRGRSSGFESGSKDMYPGGAPWPVVDLKAAVRYLRYNASKLPFATERVLTFGFGMGGGVSAVMGAMGDSALYEPYLKSIGAATHDAQGSDLSDATFGSASWCPITSFDMADASYEWMMGQFSNDGTRADGTWTKLLSTDLANAYGNYINEMDLRDEDGNQLTLDSVEGAIMCGGGYYDQVMNTIEDSAASFLSGTSFPYTYTPSAAAEPIFPGDPNLSATATPDIEAAVDGSSDASAIDTTKQTGGESSASATPDPSKATGVSSVQSTVYDSLESYITTLNQDYRWITYNSRRETVSITGLWDFVSHCKAPTRAVGAFDMIDLSSNTNQLFGIENESTLHFDQTMGDLLDTRQDAYAQAQGFDASYVSKWKDDLAKADSLESTQGMRVAAMNPLYTLSGHYEGFGTAKVAPHWRINSGIFQKATSLTTELNLALALKHYDGVSDVAFEPVWNKGFELAEREGDAQDNLIAWVSSVCSGQTSS